MNNQTTTQFWKFIFTRQDAVSSTEYALMGSLIAVVIAGAVGVLGANNLAMYNLIANCVTFATSGTGSCS